MSKFVIKSPLGCLENHVKICDKIPLVSPQLGETNYKCILYIQIQINFMKRLNLYLQFCRLITSLINAMDVFHK